MKKSKFLQTSFVLGCLLASSQSGTAGPITPPSPNEWPKSGYMCYNAVGDNTNCTQDYTDTNKVTWRLQHGSSDGKLNGKPMPTKTTELPEVSPISSMKATYDPSSQKTWIYVEYGSKKDADTRGVADVQVKGTWVQDGNEFKQKTPPAAPTKPVKK